MQEDPFIGSTFPTPKGGVLRAIKLDRVVPNSKKYYTLTCSICSLDCELWPSGSIVARADLLSSGGIPCACVDGTRWQEWQYKILVSRALAIRGYDLIGLRYPYVGAATKVSALCKIHGEFNKPSINNILRGVGCPGCKADKTSRLMMEPRKTNDEIIKTFSVKRKLDGTSLFFRAEKKNYWSYTCEICSNDEYVKAGLCSGVFTSFSGTLQMGGTSCRCSQRFIYTKEQRAYQINKIANHFGVQFVGWHSHDRFSTKTKATLRCNLHGDFSASCYSVVFNKSLCPGCKKTGFKQTEYGFIYALKSDCGGYIKVGISNNPEKRIRTLKKATPFDFSVEIVLGGSGKDILALEGKCHSIFDSAGLSGFDGCTEWLKAQPEIINHIEQQAL